MTDTIAYSGITSTYTIQTTGTYDITAFGAQGGSSGPDNVGGRAPKSAATSPSPPATCCRSPSVVPTPPAAGAGAVPAAAEVACNFGVDLLAAGIGQGQTAFSFVTPVKLRAEALDTLHIRRAADGAELTMTHAFNAEIAEARAPRLSGSPPLRLVA